MQPSHNLYAYNLESYIPEQEQKSLHFLQREAPAITSASAVGLPSLLAI